MKAISEAKIKTDKTNAETLAHFLRANLIPESYMVSKASREVKNVLRDSMFWVRVKTMVKSRIRTLVVRHPETTRDL